MPNPISKTWLATTVLLALVTAFAFQGSRGLFESTEGRYALCAWEMVASGNYLTPTLHGKPHWTKPPMGYWAIAAGLRTVGKNSWGARLANAVAFSLTVLLTGWLGVRMFGSTAGWLAALIYATSLFPVMVANTVNTDTLLGLWEILAVCCFWQADDQPRDATSRNWLTGMWAAFGCGFLTKGPPALLPLAVILLFLVFRRRQQGKAGIQLITWPGLALFLVLGFGWYILMVAWNPDLFRYFLEDEVVLRVATDRWSRNPEWYQPFRIYLPLLLFGGGLWSWLLGCFAWRTKMGRRPAWAALFQECQAPLFLLLWLMLPLVIFSLSRSRLPDYVLPLFPVMALVMGREAARNWNSPAWRRAVLVIALISAGLLTGMKWASARLPDIQQALARSSLRVAGRPLVSFFPRNSIKRDMRYLYELCRKFDQPSSVFVLVNQAPCFGFYFYAASPVLQAYTGKVPVPQKESLSTILERLCRPLPGTPAFHVLVCRTSDASPLEAELRQQGLRLAAKEANPTWTILQIAATPADRSF